jgi:hypothetical protein
MLIMIICQGQESISLLLLLLLLPQQPDTNPHRNKSLNTFSQEAQGLGPKLFKVQQVS